MRRSERFAIVYSSRQCVVCYLVKRVQVDSERDPKRWIKRHRWLHLQWICSNIPMSYILSYELYPCPNYDKPYRYRAFLDLIFRFVFAIKWQEVIDYENELRKLISSLIIICDVAYYFGRDAFFEMLKLLLGLKFYQQH